MLFILFFFFFFSTIPNFISSVYLDTGHRRIEEFSSYSFQNNSTYMLLLIQIILFSIIILFYKSNYYKLSKIISKKIKLIKYEKMILLLLYFIIIILFINLFLSQIPLFNSEVNKMNFWINFSKFSVLKPLNSQLLMYILIVGLIFNSKKKKSFFSIELVYVYLVSSYMILMGYKFGYLILIFYTFFLPTFLRQILLKEFRWKKIILYFTLLFVLLIIFVTYIYSSRYGNGNFNIILDILKQRILIMPAEVWNHAFHIFYQDKTNINQIYIEISNIYSNTFHDKPTGMDYIMQYLMTDDMYNHYKLFGVILSEGFPQILFLIFDNIIIILLIIILMFIFVAFVQFQLLINILQQRIVLSILWLKISLMINAFYGSGNLTLLFNYKLILWGFLISFVYLIHVSQKKLKRKKNASFAYN